MSRERTGNSRVLRCCGMCRASRAATCACWTSKNCSTRSDDAMSPAMASVAATRTAAYCRASPGSKQHAFWCVLRLLRRTVPIMRPMPSVRFDARCDLFRRRRCANNCCCVQQRFCTSAGLQLQSWTPIAQFGCDGARTSEFVVSCVMLYCGLGFFVVDFLNSLNLQACLKTFDIIF